MSRRALSCAQIAVVVTVALVPHIQQTRSASPVTELTTAPLTEAAADGITAPASLARASRPAATPVSPPATKRVAAARMGSNAVPAKPARMKTTRHVVRGPTSWSALNNAIARIPNYRPGVAKWVVTSRYGHWGATDIANGNIDISPDVPGSRVYSVASHEYDHALTSSNYGWNWQAADAALNRWFGGGTPGARERAADCMAIAQGASWTNYTGCQNERWRQGARILLGGQRLP